MTRGRTPRTPRLSRTESDYRRELRRQMRFVEGSCRLYDDGRTDEGVRIANALRMVFDASGKYEDIARWVVRKDVHVVSTATRLVSKGRFRLSGMVVLLLNPDDAWMAFEPALNRISRRLVDLKTWWLREPVFEISGRAVSRRDLVVEARHSDGGAHVGSPEPFYRELFKGAGWSITVNRSGHPPVTVSAEGAHLAALRQIGYEVLHSPDLQDLWHPPWFPTHRVTPQGDGAVSPWDLMAYDRRAYTREQWEHFERPTFAVDDNGTLRLLRARPYRGVVHVEQIGTLVDGIDPSDTV